MIATALYTVGAMLLVFAASHIIAAAIAAPGATSAEATAPDATVPSANKANPSLLKAEAAADAAVQSRHAIGFGVGIAFLILLAALFSVGVPMMYDDAAQPLAGAALLVSAVLGVLYGVHDGKRRGKESVKGTMNMYIRAYFITLFIYSMMRALPVLPALIYKTMH